LLAVLKQALKISRFNFDPCDGVMMADA
jgi:hypothetical protein